MTEAETVANTQSPCIRDQLVADLCRLGVQPGMTLLVHSSLSALGWTPGAAVTVIQALMQVLTPTGTLVMPAHSTDYTDPTDWQNPAVPEDWWPLIRQHMPAYDPRLAPTRGLGRIAESFRTWPGVQRSGHPHFSFAAWGQHATDITAHHSLHYGLGEGSPLKRVYALGGWVLLLGVGYNSNTSFHLAEYRVPNPPLHPNGAPIIEHGQRVWKILQDINLDEEPFVDLGADFEKTGLTHIGKICQATARLFPQRAAVDFATAWLANLYDSNVPPF